MAKLQRRNVFVLGYDERHGPDLLQISDVDRVEFHPLLRSDEVVYQHNYVIDKKLDKARRILRSFSGSVDAIVCHWDFPATSMTAILCEEWGLPSPTLHAVLKCSHKYWSRIEQQKIVPENTPAFCALNPFDESAVASVTLDYPFWIKPIKGYGSMLGFRINGPRDLARALKIVRQKIRRIGDPFNTILIRVDLPPEVEGVDGNCMIAEELIHGHEIAPEGSVQRGRFHAHGMIDMVRDHNHKSFLRYEYPSRAPLAIQQRALEVAEKVLQQIGFDKGCFNMEFFWDKETDKLWIIEINPRISQSHCYQFEKVDGMSNHEIAVHVALGEQPHFQHGKGPYKHAAEFLLRHYSQEDGIVVRAPLDEELEQLKTLQPDTNVRVKVNKGQYLSSLVDQDAYSYVLAEIKVAGQTEHEMLAKYHQALGLLPFEIRPVEGGRKE
ncbi:ATP-grasp domain-containing protein [Methylomarinum sp. Ch1-1]|uniref:ATP-grasp domain-containing protein n=1 Tax=Methylomarinum roseum TaxID=3067653 RepID=A0AAU7P015_9GAMM|nr:ATP-grasp domain-containing protein [Methylomarinum sp. Ch1-1]MDP4520163.1 ATP-grasp domain-containing protein [Methylomarinum sp. Ch1-1]